MSIIYYANRVKETSTTTGNGNLVLSGPVLGFKSFTGAIGADKELTYYIYRQDTDFEWEIGVGHILSSGGVNQLVRDRVVSSSNSNNLVGFTSGTKFIETIVSENLINNGLLNVEEKTTSFSPEYAPALYIVDASSGNVTVTLPEVASEDDPIIVGFLLSSTSGSIYEQNDAILLQPYGSETINGSGTESISILKDYLQLVSVPSQSGWMKIDPIQDSTYPYGDNGYIQFKYNDAFSGVNTLFWDNSLTSLLIGDSGVATADIVLASPSGQSIIFNQRLYDKDFRVAGTGNSHLLFVDGGLNKVGINTAAPTDILSINANNNSGLHIYKSGLGPTILLGNTSVSGSMTSDTVGSIVFSGLNSSSTPTIYASIRAKTESVINTSEDSNISIEIMNNGSFEEAAVFSPSGITLGFNNSNLDGNVIGVASANEGNNVVLGYYNNVCGTNCTVIGDNIVISSGSFGGAIGSDHAVSGNNIWVFGGENVSTSGNNKVYLAVNNDNYLAILDSGNLVFNTVTDNNTNLNIKNNSVLTSGIDQSLAMIFKNNSGVEKTGLSITSSISSVASGTENTYFVVDVLGNGSSSEVVNISNDHIVLGSNSYSGDNTIIGYSNTITDSGNYIIGQDISATGNNNIIIGTNISCSGSNLSIFGRDNVCLSSGNLNVVIFGKGNEVDEDNVVSFGIDNANSGLYSFSMGYMNGVHGDYSVGVGHSNLVNSDSSVAIGNNNNVSSTSSSGSVFAMGIGNYGEVSDTGFIIGYTNEIYGSGGLIFGNSVISSGNNIVLGNNCNVTGVDNIIIGNNRDITNTGLIELYSDKISLNSAQIELASIVSVSGSGSLKQLFYQNDTVKSIDIASSGTFVTPLQLTSTDTEYQFLYPTGTSVVYLPNGTGLFMGKKFTIINMSGVAGAHTIGIRKSGSLSDLVSLSSGYNISIIHGGNNEWIRIAPAVQN
jgi:hypothetical protein